MPFAAAQPPPDPAPTEGRDALGEALAAYQQGRLLEARRWFLLAHEQEQSARTLRGLGVVSFALGEYVEAIAYLEASLRHPVRPLTGELVELVGHLLEEAERHVARVQILGGDERLDVRLDGRPAPLDGEGGFYTSPGPHRLVVRASGELRLDEELSLEAGATRAVAIEPPADTAAEPTLDPVAVAAYAEPPAEPDAVRAPSRRRRVRVAVASAITGAGLVSVGATLFFIARHRHEGVLDQCREGCVPDRIDQLYAAGHIQGLEHSGIALSTIGLAATVTGVVLRYTRPHAERVRAAVLVGPPALTLRGTF